MPDALQIPRTKLVINIHLRKASSYARLHHTEIEIDAEQPDLPVGELVQSAAERLFTRYVDEICEAAETKADADLEPIEGAQEIEEEA